VQDKKRVPQRCGILPDPGISEQIFKLILLVDIVVTFQYPAPEGFAEPPGTQKHRVVHGFEFFDVVGFIHKITVIPHNFHIIGVGV
jgi:hypothetical protein